MNIVVNGRQLELSQSHTIQQLLDSLGLLPDRCAVELNRHLVRREAWQETRLNAEDQVEIVQFVGGG